ncbi:MAG: hypothetical protein SA339_09595 [Methanomassiliicoccus sp.]|nr:hypothetical protein [Methanomassiliicoccus sp.]
MNLKKSKVTGTSLFMLLGAIGFVSLIVSAAIIWDSIQTDSKDPQVVYLLQTDNEWNEITDSYAVGDQYNVTMTANYGGSSTSTYYITITESSTGTKSTGDFTVTMTVDGDTVGVAEYSTGVYGSVGLTATPGTSQTIVVTIEPEFGSLDLSGVSWTIAAGNTDPYVPL